MRLSVLYEAAAPHPYDPEVELRVFQEALEQIEFADKLGFHTVWAVEHHFLEELAHLSSPEVFLAAASQRARNMRIGHGIMHTVPRINHPFRVAERIATLDLVSGGRVEFGSGEGASEGELGGFNVDVATKREEWEEGLDFVIKAMTERPFAGYEGKYVSAPPRNVVPKPAQRPHPPLWMATSRRETITLAAQKGMGALGFFFLDNDTAREWVDHYFETFESQAVPVGHYGNPNIVLNLGACAAPTREQAWERFGAEADFFTAAGVHYYREGRHVPGKTELYGDFMQARNPDTPRPEGSPVGSIDDVAAVILPYEDMEVDQILLMPQIGPGVAHEHVMESLELIGTQLLPELHRRHEVDAPKREAYKNKLREKAAERRGPIELRQPPADYSFGIANTGMKKQFDAFAAGSETHPEAEA